MKFEKWSKKVPSWLKSLTYKDKPDEELIKLREGKVLRWYKDSLGKLTGGYGHLQKPGEANIKITETVAHNWLLEDMKWAEDAANAQCLQLPYFTEEFREVLISVNFQLGGGWTKKFPSTWGHMKAGRFDEAAWEAEDSLWAKQTPVRVRDLQRALWRLSCIYEVYQSL